MSAAEHVAAIESAAVPGDVVSTVRALDALRALLDDVDASDAVTVLLALCSWADRLDQHDDVRDYASRIAASEHVGPYERIWAQYWWAHASAQLDDDAPDPSSSFLEMLAVIGDDTTPAATTLGNRLWGTILARRAEPSVLDEYLIWTRPRFAAATPGDRWLIARRAHDHLPELLEPAAACAHLQDMIEWPHLDVESRRMLRGLLAPLQRDLGLVAEARFQYLAIAAEATAEPPAFDLELSSRMQAARLGVQLGDPDLAIAELEQALAAASVLARPRHESTALVRLTLTEILLAHRPIEGDRAALELWEELGDDPSDEVARLAGLGLARSWAESAAPVVIERATWIVTRFASIDDPDVRTLVVMALNSRTRALAESGDEVRAAEDAELSASLSEHGVPDFVRSTARRNREALQLRRGEYGERDEIYAVARQLSDDADAASARGESETSARLYARVFDMTRLSEDSTTRVLGLAALRAWTFDLLAARADAQAADVARRSIEAGVHDGQVGSELLAQAWLHFGIATNRLSDRASAVHAFSQVSVVAADRRDASMQELCSQADWNLAVLLDDGNQPEEALRAYARVIARLSNAPAVTDQRRVAKALKNSAVVLRDEVGRPQEAVAAWTRIVELYSGHPDAELARLVAEAQPHARPPRERRGWRRRG